MGILDDIGVSLKNFGPAERIFEVGFGDIPQRVAFLDDMRDLAFGRRRRGKYCRCRLSRRIR